ncbi:uncharacterized protein AruCF_1417 [Achromobacter ruhlandii]|nr:uncharacterized protein AruCF_1417 [Achromobacter ruhlandii]
MPDLDIAAHTQLKKADEFDAPPPTSRPNEDSKTVKPAQDTHQ